MGGFKYGDEQLRFDWVSQLLQEFGVCCVRIDFV